MKDRVLVTGATGKLGRELVRLLGARGEQVRAATRFPTRAKQLFGEAMDIVELDYEATETYDAAVQWVDRMFLMPPPFDAHAWETLVPFLDWAVAAGVGRVVLLSAMGAESMPELALRKLELHIDKLNIAAVHIRPNLYHQNFASGHLQEQIRTEGVFRSSAGGGRVSYVDVRDVAAVAALALTTDMTGSYTLTGPAALSGDDVAAALSDAAGRPIRYEAVSAEAMREILRNTQLADGQVEVAIGLLESVAEGRREPVRGDVGRVLHRPPIAFDEFVREHARLWQ
jgi:uncharacterized protein YbjT (DUF2867 family)